MNESCCDENGLNCADGQAVPNTCPVGCAVVFPEFLETCRDFVRAEATLDEAEFEQFEQECLDQDGVALVEYAIDLRDSGCRAASAYAVSGATDDRFYVPMAADPCASNLLLRAGTRPELQRHAMGEVLDRLPGTRRVRWPTLAVRRREHPTASGLRPGSESGGRWR